MDRTNTRTRRGFTAAAIGLTALAVAAPGAGAAASGPAVFSGVADAVTLDLTVDAPLGLLDAVTGGGPLSQKISLTGVSLNSSGLAEATSSLLSGLLNQKIDSSSGETTQRSAILEQDIAGIVSVGAGIMEYTADASQNLTSSVSELAHIRVTIAPLFSGALPVPEEVTNTVQDAVQAVTDTVNGLVGELNGVLDQVEVIVEDTVGEVVDIPDVNLPQVPDITEVTLVDITKLRSESIVTTTADMVRAESTSTLLDINLLGGLVRIPALTFNAWAQTNGQPGGADAGGDVTYVAIVLADGTEVSVSGSTLTVGDYQLDLSDPDLSGLPAGEILAPVTDLLGELLDALGLPSILQGDVVTDVAPDGSRASAVASPFALAFAPLNAVAGDLLGVNVTGLGVSAAVSAAPAPAPAPEPAPNPEPAPEPNNPSLPRTGAGTIAMALGALAMGGSALMRRRMK